MRAAPPVATAAGVAARMACTSASCCCYCFITSVATESKLLPASMQHFASNMGVGSATRATGPAGTSPLKPKP